MRVVATSEARAFVEDRGGRLFVWPDQHRCCRVSLTFLKTSTEPPLEALDYALEFGALDYARIDADGFSVFLDPAIGSLPEELELQLRGRRRPHVEAYWDGCAYAI